MLMPALRHIARTPHSNERGMILPLVLVLVALGMLLIVPTLGHGSAGLTGTSVSEHKARELHAADSGVEDALHWLLHGKDIDERYAEDAPGTWHRVNPLPMNDSSVSITIEESGEHFLLTSVATGPKGTTIARALVELLSESTGGNVFTNAITSLGGDVSLAGGAKVYSEPRDDKAGDVYSAANLSLSPSASIEGSVYADTDITLGSSVTIDGDAHTPGSITQPAHSPPMVTGSSNPGSEHVSPPALASDEVNAIVTGTRTASDFAAASTGPVTQPNPWQIRHYPTPPASFPNAEHTAGNLTINTSTSIVFQGSLHVDGNLAINSSGRTFVFNDPVVVGGNVTIQNGHAVFADSLWTGGDLVLSGSGTAEFEGPVRVGQDMNLGSGGDVAFGSTIYCGRDLSASGSRSISLGGDMYVGRHISLTGSSKFVGGHTLVAIGNVSLTGATKIEDTGDLPFILTPTGGFSVSGSGYASAAVYAPQANVPLTGSAKVYGALVCNSISLVGSTEVEFPVALRDRTDLPGTGGIPTVTALRVLSYELA
jgi:hypothetical protein